MINARRIAQQLHTAEQTGVPIPFLSKEHPELNWSQARQIAKANDSLRAAEGQALVGYKLGWTSEAMRNALGVDRPNWGTLWESNVCGAVEALGDFIHPKLEPELVFRSSRRLSGAITATDVLSSDGEWALGIEVVDPRYRSFAFEALDNTADNSSRAGVRIGNFARLTESELAETVVELTNSSTSRSGPSSQAMGSPAEAVAWLVRQIHEEGLVLPAGAIVFTGGLTAPYDVELATTYELRSRQFDSVSLRFD